MNVLANWLVISNRQNSLLAHTCNLLELAVQTASGGEVDVACLADKKGILVDVDGIEARDVSALAGQLSRYPTIWVGREAQTLGLISLPDVFTLNAFQEALHKASILKKDSWSAPSACERVMGVSPSMGFVREMIGRAANADVSVLLTGESGTGKEVIARALHDSSQRAAGPFVPINCGAIPSELLESELFGHEKGAFTGAIASRPGRFELAKGGTLFLDEIGDMPIGMQVKILRVLQERKFERVGAMRTIDADVRIVAATHKNLEDMIEQGSFREDLYFRLNVFPIEVPPLRERPEDIGVLLQEMINRCDEQGLGRVIFTNSAIESLKKHPWSGNVRELGNLVERMTIMHPNEAIGVRELPKKFQHTQEPDPERYQRDMVTAQTNLPVETLSGADERILNGSGDVSDEHKDDHSSASPRSDMPPLLPVSTLSIEAPIDLKKHLEGVEKDYINQALEQSDYVVSRAAELLSIRRTTLVEKMRKYGIQRKA
ncbi:MAG: sigma-54 interaction domain-containing protein [Pontibacterium sp.]